MSASKTVTVKAILPTQITKKYTNFTELQPACVHDSRCIAIFVAD